MANTRKIIHIDMDAFFASVEQHDNPALRGLPIAVGFDGPRGVVSTASYEARPYGVHSAMSMARARRQCPSLVVVPCRFDRYKEVSAQVHAIFRRYTDLVEPLSLDEAFLDVTFNKADIDLAQEVARRIKDEIFQATGLTASAGISYCKFLAKIASDYRKPNGMYTVHPARAQQFIDDLKIERFWGVGPKTAEKMHALGIYYGHQLRATSLAFLTRNFGKMGQVLYDFARGIDDRPVTPTRERKSVGCEETFLADIHRPDEVNAQIESLIQQLARRLAAKGFEGRTLTLKVKYHDFALHTHSVTAPEAIVTADDVRAALPQLLQQMPYSVDNPIRLLGLSVSRGAAPVVEAAPVTIGPTQLTLFDWLDDAGAYRYNI